MSEEHKIYLKDYRKPEYLIPEIELEFEIFSDKVIVSSSMQVVKNCDESCPLKLNGKNIELKSIKIDNVVLSEDEYLLEDEILNVKTDLDKFTLDIVTSIDPYNNTSLEGLYKSDSILCTQNEPEGFRRITYFADRPDVMSRYTTKIIADKSSLPLLLSNGNKTSSGDLTSGRHFVCWEDPFPKPSYLFALVAGDLDVLEGTFTTMSKRDITLSIFVDKGKTNRAEHAMTSLKKSMKWDEERFGLECDLDNYMIVSVDSFNAGAMENKGLNIFNSKYTLGDKETATDLDLRNIEAVIAHEYFHNWTGNRITCRDWFQLTLKEGLTVFRDHEFSADMIGESLQRINSVRSLRIVQFSEDSGPLAHPIRPESYMEINNFYTSTVYEKGQEIIRMIQTFIGKDLFNKGITKYFELYDGQAVTTDEFIHAMEIVSNRDFTQFKNWYRQAGTPLCNVSSHYDKENKSYSLTVKQEQAPNIKEIQKPFYFPLSIALFDSAGKQLQLSDDGDIETLLTISKPEETFIFKNITEEPVPSILRDFCAPVKLNYKYSIEELIFLFKYDTDSFNRFEAGQRLAYNAIEQIINSIETSSSISRLDEIIDAFGVVLTDKNLNPELCSKMLTIPTLSSILEKMDKFSVNTAFEARETLLKALAGKHEKLLKTIYCELSVDLYQSDNKSIARRSLKNSCLALLCVLEDKYDDLAYNQFKSCSNMTDTMSALYCLSNSSNIDLKQQVLGSFYAKWKHDSVVINSWFTVQAIAKYGNVAEVVEKLSKDEIYDSKNPNKINALFGAFAVNLYHFHDKSGSGYKLMTDTIIELDKRNPHVSARLGTCYKKYSKLDDSRKAFMKVQLDRILAEDTCSKGLYEIISMIINS